MMPYIFCLLVDLASYACVAWLGWLIYHGASLWLLAIMLILSISTFLPGRDIFTCPRCGHIGEVKVYKGYTGITVGVQKEKGTPDD